MRIWRAPRFHCLGQWIQCSYLPGEAIILICINFFQILIALYVIRGIKWHAVAVLDFGNDYLHLSVISVSKLIFKLNVLLSWECSQVFALCKLFNQVRLPSWIFFRNLLLLNTLPHRLYLCSTLPVYDFIRTTLPGAIRLQVLISY